MKILLAALAAVLLVSTFFAIEISWMHVRHRKYETGRTVNRLAFGMIAEKGNLPADGGVVAEVQLFEPNGTAVNLSK